MQLRLGYRKLAKRSNVGALFRPDVCVKSLLCGRNGSPSHSPSVGGAIITYVLVFGSFVRLRGLDLDRLEDVARES